MSRMILNRFTPFFPLQNKRPKCNHRYIQFTASLLLSFSLLSDAAANPEPDKYYARIAHNISTDKNDLDVTSLGVVSLKNNMIGHADLTFLGSDQDGDALVLDLGAGLAFNWYVSPYLSIGVSLGYNWDRSEYIAAYYPEVGIIVDVTKAFGISFSGKRYYNLYDDDEDIIMLGLVFRK
jgi:hypothetical protein